MIFFEYLRYCNKIGFPLDFDDMLAELEGLFEVLEEEWKKAMNGNKAGREVPTTLYALELLEKQIDIVVRQNGCTWYRE